jgi:acetoin utilization deacetylase AcuC-like enzyme
MDELVWFYPQGHEAHQEPGHPECPERVEAIITALERVGWWNSIPKLTPAMVPEHVLQRIHSPAYLNLLEMTSRRGGHLDADTYVTPASWYLAHQAAGGGLAVAEAVWNGKARRGFALTRPPGHHACHGQGMGFCLLNNIALAADTLIQEYSARRLGIVDLDLHHGNGTQEIFWQRGDVFYLSTHQSPFYPGTGNIDEIGDGDGEGCNANFPLPAGSGDQAFLTVVDDLILPLLAGYQPEMILISYGFDPHWSDPLGHLLLSAQGISEGVRRIVNLADTYCQGRLAVFMEGGYNLEAAAACTLGVTAALLGKSFSDPLGKAPYAESQAWQHMVKQARSIWRL